MVRESRHRLAIVVAFSFALLVLVFTLLLLLAGVFIALFLVISYMVADVPVLSSNAFLKTSM